MKIYNSLHRKIEDWFKTGPKTLGLDGISAQQFSFVLHNYLQHGVLSDKNLLICCSTPEEAEWVAETLSGNNLKHNVYFFPGLEANPYTGHIASETSLFERLHILDKIIHGNKDVKIIVGSAESFLQRLPPKAFFNDNSLHIEISDIISPLELAKKLVALGYQQAVTVEEPGSFSSKGEIFDIHPISSEPVRLHYFDDMIEEIYAIDHESNRTIKEKPFEKIVVAPSTGIFTQSVFSNKLRENISMPSPGHKERFEKRKKIFASLSDGILFENYAAYSPLFFDNNFSIFDYFVPEDSLFIKMEAQKVDLEATEFTEELRNRFDDQLEDVYSDQILPEPANLYYENLETINNNFKTIETNYLDIVADFKKEISNSIELHVQTAKFFLNSHINASLPKHEYLMEALNLIKNEFERSGSVIILTRNENSKKEILNIFDTLNFPHSLRERIHFETSSFQEGFYYPLEKTLILTDGDLFSVKKVSKAKVQQGKVDLFAEQLATLKDGDYVIHSEHGIGIYKGLESISLGDTTSDFLVIHYKGNDKIYVPVYKMNLVQKHADAAANIQPENLRSNKFHQVKNRAKDSAKKLAFDLLKLQAERESSDAFAFSPPDQYYAEFEMSFPFSETPDQLNAIENILADMQKPRPMDHLVCGDVGFGKTEVAMRSAFKAVLDKKQVAVLVPTTVLALQHYHSFVKRFQGFPVNIEFLSRFKTPTESKKIQTQLAEGNLDIIIGTHKLLSDKIKYHDLGLVIVDEEQRFGVGHKEKLKVLKASVDFLTLTATPIPRTMQLAFLGLRDLSLIQTPPLKRQSIKSYLIKQDDYTLQTAINKELSRGGQVFIVHNRVQDIEQFTAYIRELVPNAKIVFAHGQLPERELEKRMEQFYAGEFQILISTTIIESGIDIPNANTMIIDRADTFGLSQLHQLRGRIGRSERKAYAYFVIPKSKQLTEVAEKRLKALQTYADMGSGFNIASCDLEIRGAGDILGGEQSGHVEAVGLELYTELLKEAIAELKGEQQITQKNIEISTPFPSYIPNNYIQDSAERLKQYKKISNCNSKEEIQEVAQSLDDIYGPHPEELSNLLTILQVRLNLQHCGLKSISMAGKQINLKFEKSLLESKPDLRDRVIKTFMAKPKKYQFFPDYTVSYSHKEVLDQKGLLEFSEMFAGEVLESD